MSDYIRYNPNKLVGVYVLDSICRAQQDFRFDIERILPGLFPFLKSTSEDDQGKIKKLVELWISTNVINTLEIRNEFEKHFGTSQPYNPLLNNTVSNPTANNPVGLASLASSLKALSNNSSGSNNANLGSLFPMAGNNAVNSGFQGQGGNSSNSGFQAPNSNSTSSFQVGSATNSFQPGNNAGGSYSSTNNPQSYGQNDNQYGQNNQGQMLPPNNPVGMNPLLGLLPGMGGMPGMPGMPGMNNGMPGMPMLPPNFNLASLVSALQGQPNLLGLLNPALMGGLPPPVQDPRSHTRDDPRDRRDRDRDRDRRDDRSNRRDSRDDPYSRRDREDRNRPRERPKRERADEEVSEVGPGPDCFSAYADPSVPHDCLKSNRI
jgi:hypothetical protein